MADVTEESGEHFFMSFTDLLVGVIFLFMLLLMVFALNLKNPTVPKITTEEVRTNILNEIARRMEARGMPVTLDLDSGIVRIPESQLFNSGEWILLPQGQDTVRALAEVLQQILPCATESTIACEWEKQPISLDSVLVEGHTDNRPFAGPGGVGNWELSASRAISVYKMMVFSAPELGSGITNLNHQPMLGISAYADRRPVSNQELDPNRRIDVRFNMRANPQAK